MRAEHRLEFGNGEINGDLGRSSFIGIMGKDAWLQWTGEGEHRMKGGAIPLECFATERNRIEAGENVEPRRVSLKMGEMTACRQALEIPGSEDITIGINGRG